MKTPQIKPFLRKSALRLVGVALVAYMGYFYYSLATGEERVTQICKQMKPGMPLNDLIALAHAHGLGGGSLKTGVTSTYLAEARSFGRHACRVELENGVVTSATYNFAD